MATSTGPIRDDIDALDAAVAAQAPGQASGYMIAIPIDLALLTGAMDVVTDMLIGHKFELIGKPQFVVTEVGVGDAKTLQLVVDIGATPTTGGITTVTTALTAALGGAILASAAFSALNTGSATDVISIRAATVTAFTSGKGVLYIRVKPVA